MVTPTQRIGLTFKFPRLPRERQEAIVRACNVDRVIHMGAEPHKTWRDLIRETVVGDTLIPVALVAMPTERKRGGVAPTDQVGELLAEFGYYGVVIEEALTGRRSDSPADRPVMIREAVRGIRGGGRQLPVGSFERGRPAADCSAVLEAARAVWKSRDYSTNDAAVAHMPACKDARTGADIPWTKARAYDEFGASGRPWPKRKRKR